MTRHGIVAGGLAGLVAIVLALGGALGGCAEAPGGIHARMAWSEQGMRVVDVPEGPAAEAGLENGDRIVSIDGAPVSTLTMREAIEKLRGEVGTKVKLEVLRDGEVHTLQIARAPYD